MQLDWVTFGLEIVNFLVLIWILQRFLYRPVLQTIARRKAAVEKTLADAGARQSEAQALERQYLDRLADWEKEKEALRTQALESVKAERAQRMADLQRALDEERQKRQAVEQRQSAMLKSRLEQDASAQGAHFAARLLAEVAATPETELRLASLALEELSRLPQDRLQALRAACREGKKLKIASAFVLPERERRALEEALHATLGEDLSVEFREDSKLIAGLRIGAGPFVLDANLGNELKLFAEAAAHG